MAMSQSFCPLYGVLEKGLAILVGKWAIGSTGAVGTKTGGVGLTLARNSAGNYTIQLIGSRGVAARVFSILKPSIDIAVNDLDASNDTDSFRAKLVSVTDSTGAIVFICVDEADVVRELPSGAVVMVNLFVKLSSVVR